MTLVSEIITRAYRISNLLAIGAQPTADQQSEALFYINRVVKSTIGNEAGDQLQAFPIGRNDISRPAGYPWWDTTPNNDWFVPKNYRLMCNLNAPLEVFLHPDPDDGSRFAVIDVSGNFATNPLTVSGNGRLIDSADSVVFNTNGTNVEYFYRDDLASWQKYAPLELTDVFPFSEDFDVFFIVLLAIHLNPAYGQSIDQQTQTAYNRAARQLKARYTQIIPVRAELGLIRMPRTAYDRDVWGDSYWFYDPDAMFQKGWPF